MRIARTAETEGLSEKCDNLQTLCFLPGASKRTEHNGMRIPYGEWIHPIGKKQAVPYVLEQSFSQVHKRLQRHSLEAMSTLSTTSLLPRVYSALRRIAASSALIHIREGCLPCATTEQSILRKHEHNDNKSKHGTFKKSKIKGVAENSANTEAGKI